MFDWFGRRPRPAAWFAALWLLALLALIYVPDLGRGFVKDDFRWIATSRLHGLNDLRGTFTNAPMGFYRPVVAWSFAASHAAFGLNPFPYGLTNLFLTFAVAVAIAATIRRLGFSTAVSWIAAVAWTLNMHGINMAILWISGRTSLLASIWAALAAYMFTRRWFRVTGVLVLLALLSKEEPLLLPVVFALWTTIDRRTSDDTARRDHTTLASVVRETWPSFVAAAIYLALRAQSTAFTPGSAPDAYRLTLAPSVLAGNAASYVDRSMTFFAALLAIGGVLTAPRRFAMTAAERATALKGLVWVVCGFAITVMLPVRSSLYACFPSIGSALVVAAVGAAGWRAARWRAPALAAVLLLPLLLLPIYRARNARLKSEARLSADVMSIVVEEFGKRSVSHVVVRDQEGAHPSFADAFADAFPVAVTLFTGQTPTVVVSPLGDGFSTPPPETDTLEIVVRDGSARRGPA